MDSAILLQTLPDTIISRNSEVTERIATIGQKRRRNQRAPNEHLHGIQGSTIEDSIIRIWEPWNNN